MSQFATWDTWTQFSAPEKQSFEGGPKRCFNRIYYGPPGTGKTYQMFEVLKQHYTDPQNPDSRYYEVVTFHPSFSYADFMEGPQPETTQSSLPGHAEGAQPLPASVHRVVRDGRFKQLCNVARANPERRYAMAIDEINRGDIRQIFGELITLTEPEQRDPLVAADDAAHYQVRLPYSGEWFSVPHNIDIIASLNSADDAHALADTALRRRFEFVAVWPDARLLDHLTVEVGHQQICIGPILQKLNERIEYLYDRHHTIGHAYFMGLEQIADPAARFAALKHIMRFQILPLLEDYFAADWEKIRLVLGDHYKSPENQFVAVNTTASHLELFGFNTPLDQDSEKVIYRIQDSAFEYPESYIDIYNL